MTEASAPAPAKKKSGFRLWPLLSGLVLAGVLIGGLAYLVLSFKLYKVPQNGMFPTIDAGETLVGQRKPYASVNDVQRGDIVVFTVKQGGKDVDFIWRVIGLPGEEVGLIDDVVTIDGERFARTRLRKDGAKVIYQEEFRGKSWSVALPEPANDWTKANMTPKKLGDSELFLLGDNRHDAQDCRFSGPVAFSTVVAKLVYP